MHLLKPATLWICPDCGAHGHIVLSDGTISKKFANVQDGIEEAERLYVANKICKEEALFVIGSIEKSGLPICVADALSREYLKRVTQHHQADPELVELVTKHPNIRATVH